MKQDNSQPDSPFPKKILPEKILDDAFRMGQSRFPEDYTNLKAGMLKEIDEYYTNKFLEDGRISKTKTTPKASGNQVDKLSLEAYQLEDELFKMVYQWGRVGVVVDLTAPAFQDILKEVLEAIQ